MSYLTVVTRVGAALEAASKAGGEPVVLSEIAVGDGGGAPVTPSAEMKSLVHERWRGQLSDLHVDPLNPDTWIPITVIPDNVGGFTLREIGLFTQEGDLYAVGSLPQTDKPLMAEGAAKTITLRMPITISSDANVKLLVDPSVALATHEYVDRAIDNIPPPPVTSVNSMIGDVNIPLAGAASATADGTPGLAIYAADNDSTSRDKSATPMVAAIVAANRTNEINTIISSAFRAQPILPNALAGNYVPGQLYIIDAVSDSPIVSQGIVKYTPHASGYMVVEWRQFAGSRTFYNMRNGGNNLWTGWNEVGGGIVDSWRSGSSWYRKYSNGFVEQGGNSGPLTADGYLTLNFLVPMVAGGIGLFMQAHGEDGYMLIRDVYNTYSTSVNIRARGAGNFKGYSWWACGMATA